MCIVTYVPFETGFVFTSNRDEQIHRPALPPMRYQVGENQLIYPKDQTHGGTWMAVDSQKQRLSCILNSKGVFPPTDIPKKSRGLLAINSLTENPCTVFSETALKNVAPFICILIDPLADVTMTQFHWDGLKLHTSYPALSVPKIWCSSSLYSETEKLRIESYFYEKAPELSAFPDQIVKAHKNTFARPKNSVVYLEQGKDIQTVSISSYFHSTAHKTLHYEDLVKGECITVDCS